MLFGCVAVRAGEAIPVTVLGDFGFVQLGSVGKVLRAPISSISLSVLCLLFV